MVTAAWLKNTELFSVLEELQLGVILSHSSVESFPEGRTIFHHGDEAHRLYVLIEGIVTLAVETGEKIDMMTSTIDKEGAIFGMPCLLEPFRYNVTATCLKPSKVLIIAADQMIKLIEQDPKMGMEIMRKLASIYFKRLNEMREGVSKLLKVFKFKTP
jgi:CRP-like cAMP-binding protein